MSSSDDYLNAFGWMFDISLTDEDIAELSESLREVAEPIRIYFFVRSFQCPTCKPAIKLAESLKKAAESAGKQELVKVGTYSLEDEPIVAKFFEVDRVPSILLLNGYIRFTGVPLRKELPAFMETLVRTGSGSTGLSDEVIKELIPLTKKELRIKILVTPTCPYCPYVVLLGNMFAYLSHQTRGKLTSESIELYENQDIALKYGVMSVPAIAINDDLIHVGSVSEWELLELLKNYISRKST